MFSTKILLSVAAGGGIGAAGRYLASSWITHWVGSEFPYATLTVNIVGAFIMGALVTLMGLAWSPSAEMRSFLTTGVLGGFTTFSLFSLEVGAMVERGDLASATIYSVASVLLCVGAFFLGIHMMRVIA